MAARTVATATVRAVKRKLLPTRQALILTPAAVNRIKELLKDKTDCVGLKIGVRQRGCNGLSYTLDYASTKEKLDEEVVQDGIHVFIDRKAQLTLLGTEMDYVQNKLSSEFVFNNPNIKGTCGCGESFKKSVDTMILQCADKKTFASHFKIALKCVVVVENPIY